MKLFDIFVDSGANIPEYMTRERDIKVISFTITVNGEERTCYEEGVPFRAIAKCFYDDMRSGAEIKTSLIGSTTFYEAVAPTLKQGRDAIIITISSGISGTCQQARAAKNMLEEEFPKNKIYVIDSANASMGTGLLALKAADLRDMGESVEACAKWLEDNTYKLNSYLTVGDLKYLRRSGRISTTLAIAGSILNIKPILKADGGANAKIVSHGKERGRKRALHALFENFKLLATDPENARVAITHADCEEDAMELADMLRSVGVKDIIIEYYDLCTGSHVGPGTIALFFMGKDRRSSAHEAAQKHSAVPHPYPAK